MAAYRRLLTGFILALVGASCMESAVASASNSIVVQLLDSDYTGLARLLEEADLLSDLEQDGYLANGITIFAPSDHYLANKVSPALLDFLSQPANTPFLRKVLLNHIVPRKVPAEAWFHGETVVTLAGENETLYVEGSELKINGKVVKLLADLEAEDGVVHALNGFLVPPDIMRAASAESEFRHRSLVGLEAVELQSASAPAPSPSTLTDTVIASLNRTGDYAVLLGLLRDLRFLPILQTYVESGQPFTLAAPEDKAFGILSGLSSSPDQNIIVTILMNHVIKGAYTFEQLKAIGAGPQSGRRLLQTAPAKVTTLANATIGVRTVGDTVYLNTAQVFAPDRFVQTGQISVQGIDQLLIPPSITLPPTPSPADVVRSPPPSAFVFAPPLYAPPPPSAGHRLTLNTGIVLAMAALAMAVLGL